MKEMWPFNNIFKGKKENIDVVEIDELITNEELEVFDIDFQNEIKRSKINLNTKIDQFIKTSKPTIKTIDAYLKKLIKELEEPLTGDELIQKELELIKTKEQIFIIKKQYLMLKQNEKIGFEFKEKENEIANLNYQFKLEDVDLIKEFVLRCQEELKMLLSLIEKNSNKKEETASVKMEVSINKQLENNTKLQNQFLTELTKKVKQFHDKEDQLYLYGLKNMSKCCESLTLEYSNLTNKTNLLLGGLLLNNSVRAMRNLMSEKKLIYLNIDRYESNFHKGQKDIKGISNLLNDAISQLDLLKHEFEYNYWEFKENVPTYDLIYQRLDFIEQELYNKNNEIKDIEE